MQIYAIFYLTYVIHYRIIIAEKAL